MNRCGERKRSYQFLLLAVSFPVDVGKGFFKRVAFAFDVVMLSVARAHDNAFMAANANEFCERGFAHGTGVGDIHFQFSFVGVPSGAYVGH